MKALLSILAVVIVAQGDRAHGDDVAIEANGLQVRVDGVSKAVTGDVKAVVETQAALTLDKTVTPPLADDLSFFVRQRYHDLGYRDAEVTWEVAGGTALLHVNEGQRYTIGAISYVGNTSQNESELDAYLLRATHEKLGTMGKKVPFVEADLEAGAGLVQRYYQSQGFLNAAVAPFTAASLALRALVLFSAAACSASCARSLASTARDSARR